MESVGVFMSIVLVDGHTFIYYYMKILTPPASGLSASSFQTKTFVVLVSYQVCLIGLKSNAMSC